MSTSFLRPIALTGLLAIGAGIWAGMSAVSVQPLKPNAQLPTFAGAQQQMQTGGRNVQADSQNAEPWAKAERGSQAVRDRARDAALRALSEHRGKACETDPNERMAPGLNYYLEHRAKQERIYAKSWGPEGAKFISNAWATPDDRKVERLMREAYAAGDFNLDELRSNRAFAERFVGGVKPAKIRC